MSKETETQVDEIDPEFTLDPTSKEHRRVAVATLVGTTVEWYDYFIYAQAAALVFGPQFFTAVEGASARLLVSFATVGIAFLFRPLGAVIAGYYGDRIGRKKMLVITLMLMGGATAAIGLLPTAVAGAHVGLGPWRYGIGMWAPVLLVFLRILQGFSAGGEWGGAALMAVEHAPHDQRGKFGSFPQIGVPLGLVLATGTLGILSVTLTDEQFELWGWRIPFLFSVVLIMVGMWIRLGVAESPVFEEISEHPDEVKMPLTKLFQFNGKQVLQAALAMMGNIVAGYMIVGGFILAYSVQRGLDKGTILNLVTACAVMWIITTLFSGIWSDKIGRVAVFKIGFIIQLIWVFPLFMLVNKAIDTQNYMYLAIAMLVLTISIGFTYGPQAALYVEMFPARVRYSGASIGYAVGAILGGAFAPMISQALVGETNDSWKVSVYLFVVTLVAFIAMFTIKDRTGKRLDLGATDIPGAQELEKAIRSDRI